MQMTMIKITFQVFLNYSAIFFNDATKMNFILFLKKITTWENL